MRIVLVPVLALALASCGTGDEEGVEQDGTAADLAEDTVEAGGKDTLDLLASGLSVPAQDGDQLLEVPFGSVRAATEASLAAVLGEEIERGETAECPPGPMQWTQYEGVTLNFQEDRFVGWFATEPYLPLETRGELIAAGSVTMFEDSTLGEEFTIGNPELRTISGLFADEGDEAQVIGLWAGLNCIFR